MRVPEYQQSVQQQGLPNARLTTHYTADDFMGGTQQAALQVGTNLAKSLAHDATNLAVDHYKQQLDENNQTRIRVGVTDMGTHIDTAMYGPDGALNKKGADAFLGSDGKSAMDTVYDDAVKKQAAIADTLGTDSQKSGFMQQSTAMLNAMRGTLMSHEAQEHRVYAQGSLEASTAYHVNNMNYNNNNDDGLTKSIAQIKANSLQLATLNGKPPLWGEVNAQTHISGALNKITSDMIDNGNHAGASNILQRFSQDMNQNDLAGNYSKMSKSVDQANAISIATSTMTDFRDRFTPQNGDRINNITWGTESGNKQVDGKFYGLRPDGTAKGTGYLGELKRPDGGVMTEYSIGVNINGKDMDIPTIVPTLTEDEKNHLLNSKEGEKIPQGIVDKAVAHAKQRLSDGRPVFHDTPQPITSPKGAIGAAQVMPKTAREAASLAGLPWDETKYKYDIAYNKAIGAAYFQKQLQTNQGDLEKAWAAYNAGPTALMKAISAGAADGTNWRSHLPEETQKYIAKNINAYNAGKGVDEPATLQEVQQAALAKNPSASSTERKNTLEEVNRQYAVNAAAIKDHQEYNTDQAYKMLAKNGGNYAALPQSVKDDIPGNQIQHVQDFAIKTTKGIPIETDDNLYYELYRNPATLKLTNLLAFRNQLSDVDLKGLQKLQADNNKSNDLTSVRPAKAVLDDYMAEVGINPNPKADDAEGSAKVGKIYGQFQTNLNNFEESAGHKATPDEINKLAQKLFTQIDIKGAFWGTNKISLAQLKDTDVISVPTDERAQIVQLYKAKNGGADPSDSYILSIYKAHKGIN